MARAEPGLFTTPGQALGVRLARRLRYAKAVAWRFRFTFGLIAVWFGIFPLVYVARYPGGISFGRALHHVYFLLFGQPSLEYVDDWVLEVLNLIIPPLGLGAVVDGVVRFSYLFNARRRADREWIEVLAESLKGHVVVCGAGRVGYRVTVELRRLGRDVVVVEKKADAPFVQVLRDLGVAVLIDDIRSQGTLQRLNVKEAEAIVCATDDDLSNINVGLDARKLNPDVRVVLRLFDDDLVERVRDNFMAEAHSTSALAAPALALSALDPRIIHSFHVGEHLMVVSRFKVGAPLAPLNLSALRDRFGGLTLSMKRGAEAEVLHPQGNTPLQLGDELVVQCRHEEYVALRQFCGEEKPPLALLTAARKA
ncbi:MAG: NAD-binding protein [Myxococcaceae bacterium]